MWEFDIKLEKSKKKRFYYSFKIKNCLKLADCFTSFTDFVRYGHVVYSPGDSEEKKNQVISRIRDDLVESLQINSDETYNKLLQLLDLVNIQTI